MKFRTEFIAEGGFVTQSTTRSLRNEKGFSLIELMITMAILTVVSGICSISYQNYIYNTHLRRYEAELSQMKNYLEASYAVDGRYPISTNNTMGFTYVSPGVDSGWYVAANQITDPDLAAFYKQIPSTANMINLPVADADKSILHRIFNGISPIETALACFMGVPSYYYVSDGRDYKIFLMNNSFTLIGWKSSMIDPNRDGGGDCSKVDPEDVISLAAYSPGGACL